MPADGRPRVLPLTVSATWNGERVTLTCTHADGSKTKEGGIWRVLTWLHARSEAGREPYLTIHFDDAMPLRRAVGVAHVFDIVDKGIKLDGKADDRLYHRAFLQEKWREHKDRHPQPFELHVTQAEGGTLSKKLVFIEEGLDGRGTRPQTHAARLSVYGVGKFPKLVIKAGGTDSKVRLLFVHAPA